MVCQLDNKADKAALDLLFCSLHGIKLGKDFFEDQDLQLLLKLCRWHNVTALASLSLPKEYTDWHKERYASLRRTVLFDEERKQITDFFEKNGIWYCPLKGVILKDLYPAYGTREMSDNDILVDPTKRDEIYRFMVNRGYKIKRHEFGNHDAYHKDPVYNYEMHISLFPNSFIQLSRYYESVKERLLKDKDSNFGYHFSKEDFYLYFIAHNHKHLSRSGSGLRTLVDIYLYLERHKDLDEAYLETQLNELDLLREERILRSLSIKLFSVQESVLSEEETKMLNYILGSGIYGNNHNSVKNKLNSFKKTGKHYRFRYVFSRLFLEDELLKESHYFFYKHKWARPLLTVYRGTKILIKDPKRLGREIKIIFGEKND